MKTSKLPKAREKAGGQVVIGFGFASDWLRKWREFFRPITGRSKAKPKQSLITFNTQLKIALSLNHFSRWGCERNNRISPVSN